MLYIIIFIIFFLIIILYHLNQPHYDTFDNRNILFLNESDLQQLLLENKDHYYDTFSEMDLEARKIKSIEDYTHKIISSVSSLDDFEKDRIVQCMDKIYSFFDTLHYSWLDGKKLNQVPWKIGMIKGYQYENGLPHTRNDVILLSREKYQSYDINELIRILIHEKIHVYQKLYPDDIEVFKKEYGYEKVNHRIHYKNIRSNPDLDSFVYKNHKNELNACYYNPKPRSIQDIYYTPKNEQKSEHPHEYMAILIEDMYTP